MQNKILEIWKQSCKRISYSILKSFIQLMSLQKPHIQFESLQFIKANNFYLNYDYSCEDLEQLISKGTDRFDDQFQTKYDGYGEIKKIVSQIEVVNWVYFKVFDQQLGKQKTLKTQFLELTESKAKYLQKEILLQRNKIISNKKSRDLLVDIHDFYFLSLTNKDNPLYFVVEQELIHSPSKYSTYLVQQYDQQIASYKDQCLQCLTYLMGFRKTEKNKLAQYARYYLCGNNDGTFSLKLSPIDIYPLFQQLGYQPQIEYLKLENRKRSMKKTLVADLERDYPNIFEMHSVELIQLISEYQSFNFFDLQLFNKRLVQFKAKSGGQQYLLTCVKYKSLRKAERNFKLFEKLYSFEFFHKDSQCEIIPLSSSKTYLLFVELDFVEMNSGQVHNLENVFALNSSYQSRALFCWLLEKLEISLQIERMVPLCYLQIVYLGNLESRSQLQYYFKDVFTFSHMYPMQNSQLLGKDDIILKKLIDNIDINNCQFRYEYKQYQQSCQSLTAGRSISEFPLLFKAFKAIKNQIEIQKFSKMDQDVCIVNDHNFHLELGSSPIPVDIVQKVLIEYEVDIICNTLRLSKLLQNLEKPTQVKYLAFGNNFYRQNSLQKFSTIFPQLEILNINIEATFVFELFHQLKLHKIKSLYAVRQVFAKTAYYNKDIDLTYIRSFFQLFKKKQFRQMDFDFQSLIPSYQSLSNLSNQNQENDTKPPSFSKKFKKMKQKEDEKNLKFLNENLFEKVRLNDLKTQIETILTKFPKISIEATQKFEEQRKITVTSIKFVQWEEQKKDTILMLDIEYSHFNEYNERMQFSNKYKRMNSTCCNYFLSTINLYKLMKEVARYQQYRIKMQEYLEFEEFGECQHSDYNKYVMQLYLQQDNLQELNIDLRWCASTIELMKQNNNYLGVNTPKFRLLSDINIIFHEQKITNNALRALCNNLRGCRKAQHIMIKFNGLQSVHQFKQQMRQFMKLPHLVRLFLYNQKTKQILSY